MSLLTKLFRREAPSDPRGLYAAVITRGRATHWYQEGSVPDTLDGRFDMIAAILSFVMLRLETLGAAEESARLAEVFVEDMDGQLRQLGIGDLVVGKEIGKMMSALGGRLGAYRAALAGEEPMEAVLERNLYRGAPPAPTAVSHAAAGLRAFATALETVELGPLRSGNLPEA